MEGQSDFRPEERAVFTYVGAYLAETRARELCYICTYARKNRRVRGEEGQRGRARKRGERARSWKSARRSPESGGGGVDGCRRTPLVFRRKPACALHGERQCHVLLFILSGLVRGLALSSHADRCPRLGGRAAFCKRIRDRSMYVRKGFVRAQAHSGYTCTNSSAMQAARARQGLTVAVVVKPLRDDQEVRLRGKLPHDALAV